MNLNNKLNTLKIKDVVDEKYLDLFRDDRKAIENLLLEDGLAIPVDRIISTLGYTVKEIPSSWTVYVENKVLYIPYSWKPEIINHRKAAGIYKIVEDKYKG